MESAENLQSVLAIYEAFIEAFIEAKNCQKTALSALIYILVTEGCQFPNF